MFLLLMGLLFLLFGLSVPIAVSLGLATSIVALYGGVFDQLVVPQQIFNAINSFPLMAIPFFILAGFLMETGGISEKLVNFSSALVGHITGGLAMVMVLTSMFFSAISGSGAATTAAVGAILIPAMVARGYDRNYASANQAASGELGVILPPSIPLILYGVAAHVSIGDMFMAGVIPGIFIAGLLLTAAYITAKRKGYLGVEKSDFKAIFSAFKDAILALAMPIVVLGGIYGGVFTPTEAAVVAVVYSFIVGTFVYRKIKLKNIMGIFTRAAETTSVIMIIIGTAGLFGFFINRIGVPVMISDAFLGITTSAIIFILLVNLLLLVVGMFMEGAAAILILVPILLPIATALGIDPVHFGIIMVVNLAIGLITPPVGINLFVAARIGNISLVAISKAVIPFVILIFFAVLVISFSPWMSLWLPSLTR